MPTTARHRAAKGLLQPGQVHAALAPRPDRGDHDHRAADR